jgi:dihydrofolate reductase
MAKLIYSAITSLDGYVADEDGNFDWAEPDEEVHTFINDLERAVGTYLYGRRLYEVMGRLGDHAPRRSAALHAGLRGDVAGGRQDRVLQDAKGGIQRQDADRARLRS